MRFFYNALYIIFFRLTLMGTTQPMNIFLGQEIDRIQKVIELVKSSLEDLLLAINGIIIMNEVIKDCANNTHYISLFV